MALVDSLRHRLLSAFCIFVIFVSFTVSQDPPELACRNGWTLHGQNCYKLFAEKMEWLDASKTCQSYGSQLVNIFGFQENKEVAEFVQSKGASKFWIGELMGKEKKGEEGFWGGEEPMSGRECAYVEKDPIQFYNNAWFKARCNSAMPFLCEAKAILKGMFPCLNGEFIKSTDVCDGINGCGDNSDEMKCPAQCMRYLTGTEGVIATENPYGFNQFCQWTMESPVGTRIMFDFARVRTEEGVDVIQVWVGGPTTSKSKLVARISGTKNANDLKRIYSYNNFMIITFVSDSSVSNSGFQGSYRTEDILPGTGQLLKADLAETGFIQSPMYNDRVVSGIRDTFHIYVPLDRRVISLQVEDFDVGGDAYVEIYNGPSLESPILARLTEDNAKGPQVIISTTNNMTVYYNTGYKDYPGRGFRLSYRVGCMGTITADFGEVISPGYNSDLMYPDYQDCRWTVQPKTPNLAMKMMIDGKFGLNGVLGNDFLKIYEGLDDKGKVLTQRIGAGDISPKAFVSSNGRFYIHMKTTSINNGIGFKAIFSKDCPKPDFPPNSIIVPNPIETDLLKIVTVSCPAGYFFAQEKNLNVQTVTMRCTPGGWDVDAVPRCEPMYCGQPPLVQNAYVDNSTGVQYGDFVVYKCYAGFAIVGNAKVECLQSGQWGFAPSCSPASCPTVPPPQFGNMEVKFGTGVDYGTVIHFSCNGGFEIKGAPIIICQGDGTWDNAAPTCERLHCPLPDIANVQSIIPATVVFGSAATVACKTGFALEGIQTISCQADQTFSAVPKCVDINECPTGTGGPCSQICKNTVGSYKCSCNDGYKLQSNTACEDINECETNKGGCSDICTNSPGSYSCTCNPGYVLFTRDGTEGFTIPATETGKKEGDKYYLDHTCVRRKCPDLKPLVNGKILSKQTMYHYEDTVYFFCDLGFVISYTEPMKCQSNGQWDKTQPPTCSAAFCTRPATNTFLFPPVFEPVDGRVAYGQSVTLTCSQHRPTPLVFQRKCVYDQKNNQYTYALDKTLDCPVIDCGVPDLSAIPASVFQLGNPPTNTKYLAEFDIGCSATSSVLQETGNPEGNRKVVCRANGNWDFGNFTCSAKVCTDPGTPPGARQIAEGYQQGKRVSFECTKTGFTLDNPEPLTCILIGANPSWDRNLPNCIDTTKPVITQNQNLCNNSKTITKLTAPFSAGTGFTVPTASDNSGGTHFSMPMTVFPIGFQPTTVLNVDQDVTYTITDFNGNQQTCEIELKIRDDNYPNLVCPQSYTIELDSTAVKTITFPESGKAAQVTDNEAQAPTLTYSPNEIRVTGSSVGRYYPIRVQATDASGNQVECSYTVNIVAKPCQDWALRSPRNGLKNCKRNTNDDGWNCQMKCNPGYYLFPNKTSIDYTCKDGNSFIPQDIVPDCVGNEFSAYIYAVSVRYSYPTNFAEANCEAYYKQQFTQRLPAQTDFFRSQCANFMASFTSKSLVDVQSVLDDPNMFKLSYDKLNNQVAVTLAFSLFPRNISSAILENGCGVIIRLLYYNGDAANNSKIIPSSGACPALTFLKETALEVSSLTGRVCDEGHLKYQDTLNGKEVCVPCGYGHFYDPNAVNQNDFCRPCPLGQYQDTIPSKTCKACPTNTWTRKVGSPSLDFCQRDCFAEGMVSVLPGSPLAPCKQCPKSQYAKDVYTCQLCPTNTDTVGPGAKSSAECLQRCQPGFYSDTGLVQCLQCPKHFYSDQVGSTTCKPCPSDQITQQAGADSSSKCINGQTELCTANVCNNGVCTVSNHEVYCTCNAGYTGSRCQTQVNFCESSPCYAGSCSPIVNGYQCNCPQGFSGSRCEVDPDNCVNHDCQNGGMCQDLVNSFNCLCLENYAGNKCQLTANICQTDPCTPNQATCRVINSKRRVCDCFPGFTGVDCKENIDECASNPCLYGGTCKDEANGFRCTCPAGFAGARCEIRYDACPTNPCGSSGDCISDYRDNAFMCLCNQGYSADTTYATTNDLWLKMITTLTVQGVCPLTDYCTSKPCARGSCSYTPSGPACSCPGGFEGTCCQHDKDDCASKPCVHGTCIDQVDGYRCSCDVGYTGVNCQSEINFCSTPSYPCVAEGTDRTKGRFSGCDDYTTHFECICKPGYTGKPDRKDCSENIDECASNPCFHGGTCNDGVDGFTCKCLSGWTGPRCETVVDNCVGGPCKNDAQCRNTFSKYFCKCEYPNYGQACQLVANVCANPDPCIDPKAICFVNDKKKAECDCSVSGKFKGEGCHISIDYCGQEGLCQHGGTCVPMLDGFSCKCLPDYFGTYCEQSLNDCINVVIPNGGKCVDGVMGYFVECPLGKTGPTCNKDVDDDFDIFFQSESKTASASTAFPFTLGVKEFSVGLWVRYHEKNGKGTFFTLYGMDDRYADAPKREILRYDHDNVYASFGFIQEARRFIQYDINDNQWYYINTQWSSTEGKLSVMVNSVKVIEIKAGHGKGWTMPPFGMIVLGSMYDASSMPVAGSGFNGYVSKVNMWNRVLSFKTEIPSMADDYRALVLNGLILRWSDYITNFGAYVQRPSRANSKVCKNPEFTGASCNIPVVDKTPPKIMKCPETVWKHNSKRLTQVAWEAPVAEGNEAGLRSTYLNERVFIWGKYTNMYTAYDNAGNAALCLFDIFVRKQNCPEPRPAPIDGSASCSVDVWPFRNCYPKCQAGKDFSVPTPNFFTCGPQGSFYTHNPYLSFMYPACAASRRARVDVRIYITYPQIQACEEVLVVDGFGIQIRKHIADVLDKLWGESTNTGNGFCRGKPCDDVVTVDSQCSGANTVGRKRRAVSDAFITILLRDIQEVLYNAAGIAQTPKEIILNDILDNKGFDLSEGTPSIPNASPQETALRILMSAICSEGQTVTESGLECVDCAPGTYYDSTTKRCILCAVGTYQDQPRSTSCKTCGPGKTTELPGSTTSSECYDRCNPGSYLNKGTGVCQWCEIGFYQDESGQFYCKPCAADKTTLATYSTSVTQCQDVCPDGTELTQSGSCKVCPRGTYRTQGVQARCTTCPVGFITAAEKSRTETECVIPDCQPGYYHDTSNTSCKPCLKGTYQPAKWQESCITCPNRKTTLNEASISVSSCLFFCPMGMEEFPAGSSLCRLCPIGFFKDNALPGEKCKECQTSGKGGYVTAEPGATNLANCSILACKAGEQPNQSATGCEECPVGTYQPSPYQAKCMNCQAGTSTMKTGSKESNDCKKFCPDGQFINAFSICTPCPRGTYRNNKNDKFGPCESCGPTFTTVGTGSDTPDDCSVANCTAGYKINSVTNRCEECPIGQYQDEWWQTTCKSCPTQKTTAATASDSLDDCLLNCPPGFEDRNDKCVECSIGYFKTSAGSTRCTKCPDGFITSDIGATNSGQCNIEDCRPGYFLDTNDNRCYPCDVGTYQDKQWQKECIKCPIGSNGRQMTTAGQASNSKDDCILMCETGSEYDLALKRCQKCPVGKYRGANVNIFCELCPIQFITLSEGSISALSCTIANCSAGSYRIASQEVCQPCALGTYQPTKWQTQCLNCPSGRTTLVEGGDSLDDCRPSCPSGQELEEARNLCRPCPQDKYRDASKSQQCEPCPPNKISPTVGAISADQCSWEACTAGSYIRDGKCELCPDGTYQPEKWSQQCELCPEGSKSTTGGTGASSVQQCKSTDDCKLNTGLCTGLGETCIDLPGLNKYECRCYGKYIAKTGQTSPCIHKCDAGYCLNNATCDKSRPANSLCICKNDWRGERCNEEPPSMTNYIIGGAVGGFVFLIILILLIVFCCVCLRPNPVPVKQSQTMVRPVMNPAYAAMPSNIMAPAPSTIIYQTAPQSQPLQQTMIAGDAQSLPGYSTLGPQQGYMFYEDQDPDAVMQQQQNNQTYGTINRGFDPYEEKASALAFGGDELQTLSLPYTASDGTAYAKSDGGFMDNTLRGLTDNRSNII